MAVLRRALTIVAALPLATATLGVLPAAATPVCTDGYKGGPPLAECGLRIFPEAALSQSYVQVQPQPGTGFREYQHGIEFMAQKYKRWVSVSTLSELMGTELAVTAGQDGKRSYEEGDTGDGFQIPVIRLTDHEVPHPGKKTLFFSLSVHGNERGGLEGGLRAIEDLAMAAEGGGKIADGVAGYKTSTGKEPEFHEYEVKDVLAKQDVWFVDFNIDGWAIGDTWNTEPAPLPYERGNGLGTDLNRQMPTIGRINSLRNPLQESETKWGTQLMDSVAAAGEDGKLAFGGDIHGELTSRAYVDIMYPAGQFDSVEHRRLMAIAERTKSVIDKTLYAGIQNLIEEQTGGDEGEGVEGPVCDFVPNPTLCTNSKNTIPTMPAHWATVWDTLGYTDTGFIGDYLASELGVTGMDYEIFLNHIVPDKAWSVYLQENHITASRAIIKTAMAYAMWQEEEFNEKTVRIETGGVPGYVFNPAVVTDSDKNGPGTQPGPDGNGIGADGKKIKQLPYSATNMRYFEDASRLMVHPFVKLQAADIANNPKYLNQVDSLVLADFVVPQDGLGRPVDKAKYLRNIGDWVRRGGNLVLTDRAIHALGDLGVVSADDVEDIQVYQPYSDIDHDGEDHMVAGLRSNARQLVEAPILGYGIGGAASPMTAVAEAAFKDAGGTVVGTTGAGKVTLGHLSVDRGSIKVVGGALPTPTEDEDHRYGLRDYALTYSGLYIMENVIRWDAASLGTEKIAGGGGGGDGGDGGDDDTDTGNEGRGGEQPPLATTGWSEAAPLVAVLLFAAAVALRRRRAHA
ncbi:MAG TPA: hypothetical protein VNA20_18785 [Frankiaceae bacterium]|nr:hypothetical protein [Frankiaceae bacterium]